MTDRAAALLALLDTTRGAVDTIPRRGQVDCHGHALRVAQAARGDGASLRWQAVALLHDACRVVQPGDHGQAITVLLRDVLRPDEAAVLRTHSLWQYDAIHGTNRRQALAGMPWWSAAERFCRWEVASFEPGSAPLPDQAVPEVLDALVP